MSSPNAVYITIGGRSIKLPVNPETLEIVSSGNNSSHEIIEIGEITSLKAAKQDMITLTSFLPNENDDWTKLGYTTPGCTVLSHQDFIDTIRIQVGKKQPIVLTVTNTDYSRPMSIENFSYNWSRGDGCLYYTIDFKYYRAPKGVVIPTVTTKTESVVVKAQSGVTRVRYTSKFAVGDMVYTGGFLSRYPGSTTGVTIPKAMVAKIVDFRNGHYRVRTVDNTIVGYVNENKVVKAW